MRNKREGRKKKMKKERMFSFENTKRRTKFYKREMTRTNDRMEKARGREREWVFCR